MTDTRVKIDRFKICLEKMALKLGSDNCHIKEICQEKEKYDNNRKPYYKFIQTYFCNFKFFFQQGFYEAFDDLKEIVESYSDDRNFADIDRFRNIRSDLDKIYAHIKNVDDEGELSLFLGDFYMLTSGAYANTLICAFVNLRERGYHKKFLLEESKYLKL